MNLQFQRERAYRRKRLARLQFAGQDGFRRGEADLVKDGKPGSEFDLEWNHGVVL
jgi:hypothetical protein